MGNWTYLIGERSSGGRQAAVGGALLVTVGVQATQAQGDVGTAGVLDSLRRGQLDQIAPGDLRELLLEGLQQTQTDDQASVGGVRELGLESDGGSGATSLGPGHCGGSGMGV